MALRRLDRTDVLDRAEVLRVVVWLRARMRRRGPYGPRREPARNLALFRLSACCGLRAGEIAGLNCGDVRLRIKRPYLSIRGSTSKRGFSRRVPLTWDRETAADLLMWWDRRRESGAGPDDPFVCRTRAACYGRRMYRQEVSKAFRVACYVLGRARAASVCCHTGRHTFASWALTVHPLRVVQAALGHRSIGSTDRYSHVVTEPEPDGALFGGPSAPAWPPRRNRSSTTPPAASAALADTPASSPKPIA